MVYRHHIYIRHGDSQTIAFIQIWTSSSWHNERNVRISDKSKQRNVILKLYKVPPYMKNLVTKMAILHSELHARLERSYSIVALTIVITLSDKHNILRVDPNLAVMQPSVKTRTLLLELRFNEKKIRQWQTRWILDDFLVNFVSFFLMHAITHSMAEERGGLEGGWSVVGS